MLVFCLHGNFFGYINVNKLSFILYILICVLKRSVGVSNFGVQHLREMEKASLPTPAVNQIELHPFWHLDDIVDYCLEKGIAPMGYCPLFRGKKNDNPVLIEIANR